MHIISILLFALSANLDNFTVAVTYGIRKIRIGLMSNLIIAVISGIGTFLSMTIGAIICRFVPANISNIAGSLILILLGLWFIKDFFIPPRKESKAFDHLLEDPEQADADASGTIDFREAVILALALTINNFGLGIGASITGMNLYLTTLITMVFSVAAIIAGLLIGNSWISKFLGKFAPLVSGLIVVLLGIYEMII